MKLVSLFVFIALLELCDAGCYVYYCNYGWCLSRRRCPCITQRACCSGYYGSKCDIPKCRLDYSYQSSTWWWWSWNRYRHILSCNRNNEGVAIHKDGTVVTHSGGKCISPGVCANCNDGFYPTTSNNGYCKACPKITNCNLHNCTGEHDGKCDYCVDEYVAESVGHNVYTGKPDRKQCQLACSWRDGARCFPGSCGENYILNGKNEKCNCAPGFTGKNCAVATPDETPEILDMIMTLRHNDEPTFNVDTMNNSDHTTFWTKETVWSNIDITLKTKYVPHLNASSTPNYITRYSIGVQNMDTSITLQRGQVSATWTVKENCAYKDYCLIPSHQTSLSSVTNWKSILDGGSFQHEDKITISMFTKNGGIIHYEDREGFDTNRHKERYYMLQGSSTTATRYLVFDIHQPTHCFEQNETCFEDALVVQDVVKEANVVAYWSGWDDALSGIETYTFYVYYLKRLNGSEGQGELSKDSMVSPEIVVDFTQSQVSLSLEDPSPYAIELTVTDRAGNTKHARRIIFFDDVSVVEKIGHLPCVVQASESGWINKTSPEIELKWPQRYRNTRHSNHGWLNAVVDDPLVSRDLDDTPGRSTRTTAPVHNIEGIVRVEVAWHVLYSGNLNPGSFKAVPLEYFDQEHIIYPISDKDLVDGHKFIYSIRAFDFVGEFAEDNVTVMVDLSPPVTENLWLTSGDFVNISVHNVKELEELTIEFITYDIHSGINEVYWTIFDNYTNNVVVHGKSGTSAQGETSTLEECETKYGSYARGPNCYCSPYNGCYHQHHQIKPQVTDTGDDGLHHGNHIGEHDFDYFIQVTAVNNAGLNTTVYKKITIDVSPPTEGTVHDGIPGEPEIDFQQTLHLTAYWDGFFDKESGVWFYTYGFHDSCLNESTLDVHNIGKSDIKVYQTYTKTAHHTALAPGRYYITVMAYNHALDHSKAVCSDGVTIALLPADVTEVVVKGAVTGQGLLANEQTDELFVLHKNREIEAVVNPSTTCMNIALQAHPDDITILPQKRQQNGSIIQLKLDNNCNSLQALPAEFMSWIKSDYSVELSWNVSDSDLVHDFEVGIASERNEFPDIMPFTTTRHHQHTRIYHPDIFNGEIFYILIKSITKSMISAIKIIGPIVFDASPPMFSGQVEVSTEITGSETYLIAWWDSDSVSDESGPYSLTYTTAIGTKENPQKIIHFSDIMFGGSCKKRYPPNCSAFPTSLIQWHLHGEQLYVVTLKITNAAGLFVIVSSEEYQHNVVLPSRGVVHDIDMDVERHSSVFLESDDIDFQTDTTTLKSRWTGFDHPHEDITYTVCYTDQKQDNYIQCENSKYDDHHVFSTNLQLTQYETYYQVVIATTEAGNVSAISDGVTIVKVGDVFNGIEVYDGPNCNSSLNIVSEVNATTSHHNENKLPLCDGDVDYQSSSSVLNSHWIIQTEQMRYFSDIYMSVDEKAPVADFWTEYLEYRRLETLSFHTEITDLFLSPGRCYRTNVKLCASHYCYQPVHSNGVCVISSPPVTGNFQMEYSEEDHQIIAEFDKFHDPDMIDIHQAREVMDHYEWAIGEELQPGKLIYKWRRIEPTLMATTHDMITATITIDKLLSSNKCWRLFIRGYTKAGLSSIINHEIRNCSDVYKVKPNIVIDAIGESVSPDKRHEGRPIVLQTNDIWKEQDVDYTPYNNILSAVWPSLRHGDYIWAVLNIQNEDATTNYDQSNPLSLRDPCSHPDTIKCGQTDKEFINVEFDDSELIDAKRYVICIHANATVLHHELWDQDLDEVNACSDGVTIDLTPPLPGEVWIGNNKDHLYQTSTSEVSVNWNSFIDVEEGDAVHTSGITKYEVAIGSSSGGSDIVVFTDVGLTNHKIFHNLRLQSGHTYFATVRGYDFTGQSSTSTSEPVKVDSTPPERTESSISLQGRHITDQQHVGACWKSIFYDDESGISHYRWAVGTNPGTDDILPFTDTLEECGRTSPQNQISLIEGHAYYVSVMAYNKAGLYSSTSSWAFTVDESPPLPGIVFDGPRVDGVHNDVDYVDSGVGIQAHWKGFIEQHSTLAEYFIQVGFCPTCSDVVTKQSVGLNTEVDIKHIRLAEGRRYYVTITACNTADLCSSAISDGFVVDSTPPIRGVVIDGITSMDITYQASTNSLSCKWFGFIDPQSGISHYTWRVGTSRGGYDILPARNVLKHDEGFVLDFYSEYGYHLPVGVKMYCTVRAYNKGGKYVESSSNGFIIDDTAPIFTKNLSQHSIGSIIPGTSVLRSVLKVYWEVHDNESYIETQHVSISSHIGGDFNTSSKTILGIVRDYTFTGLDFHDGSIYDVHLVSCNGAKICIQSSLTILVDSTPPISGTFAINTDHAADLNRQPSDWFVWTPISIKLAWLGFEDVHTGIESYIVNIGSQYMGSDLNEVPNEPFVVYHEFNETIDELGDDGQVQTFEFRTQKLRTDSTVFISMAAYNKVGLRSTIIHAEFELVFGGLMALVRRCNTHTCLGHCVCAPHDQLCESNDITCNDVSGEGNPNTLIEVEDYLDLTFPEAITHDAFSPINTMLAAKWKVGKTQGAEPLWYEWSVGLTKHDSPMGVFNHVHHRVWHDAGQSQINVFTISRDSPNLQEHENYSYFVRAWYDENTFAIFKSKGLTIYSTPPQTISIRGKAVKEILFGGTKDVDYITKQSNVFVDWSGKFKGVSTYRLFQSTTPSGHDFYTYGRDIEPDTTRLNISGFPYEEHTKYFSIIQAYNLAGLHSTEVSDGFTLDSDLPSVGVVKDGFALNAKVATNQNTSLWSFWHSFVDSGSAIVGYEHCLSSNGETCNIKPLAGVEIRTRFEYVPELPFRHGQVVKTGIRAIDAVGHTSSIVFSDGIIIDITPPVRVKQEKCDDNVVVDSSFEELHLIHTGEICNFDNESVWQLSEQSCITIVNSTETHHNIAMIHLRGSIYQTLETPEGRYRLSFQTSIIPSDSPHAKSTVEGFISVNNDTHSFLLYNKQNTNTYAWQKHTFHFSISSNKTLLLLGTVNNRRIAIDSVVFEVCTASEQEDVIADGHVNAHTVFVHDWSTIYAEWWFVDNESPIVEYLWAIGTVKGGTQLQDFFNVGLRTHASNHKLKLLHNTEVYITVVAVNAAGLRSVSYSDVVIIDLTPPVCHFVNDGNIYGVDVDYQRALVVEVHWDITDPESGIKECQIAVGSGGIDNKFQDYIQVKDGQTNASVTLDQVPDDIVYSTIRCTNGAGLTSKCMSDGIQILDHPPTIDNVVLDIMTASETQFDPRGNYHGNKSEIRFRWTGFADNDGIESYLISLEGIQNPTSEIVKATHAAYDYACFTGLDLSDGEYTVSVVAINDVKMQSQKKSANFILLTQPPVVSDSHISTSWNKDTSVASANWAGVFTSPYPMFYEITIRLLDYGEGDLLQWQETTNTFTDVHIEDNHIPEGGATILFSVRAVGFSGLFKIVQNELNIFL